MNLVPVFAVLHIALYGFYIALFQWLIQHWKFFAIDGVTKRQLTVFFLLKVAAGIILTVVYTYYYTDQSKTDIYRYFNDSKIISSLLFHHPFVWLRVISGIGIYDAEIFRHLLPTLYFSHSEADIVTNNTLIIRIASIFNYFSFYNIYTDTLFFNFTSFVGITMLFKVLKKYFREFPQLLFIPLYLLPSVVFWSSGMLKEQLVFTFIGPLFAFSLCTKDEGNYKRWIMIVVLLYIVYCIKPSIAVCLLPALFFWVINCRKVKNKIYLSIAAVTLLCGLFFISDNSVCEKIIDKRNEFTLLAIAENAGSYFDTEMYPTDCNHLVALIPKALSDSMLQPFIWDKGNFFQLLFSIENLAFILLLIYLLIRYFKRPDKDKTLTVTSFLVFAFLNYLVIGITVPITGAIVHYRVIATPFLFIGILFFINQAALKEDIKRRLKMFKL